MSKIKNTELDLYRRAISKWGKDAQIGMLYEEMGELAAALNKWWRRGRVPAKAVWSEIVDVQIMLEQIRIITCATTTGLSRIRQEKLARLRERIE